MKVYSGFPGKRKYWGKYVLKNTKVVWVSDNDELPHFDYLPKVAGKNVDKNDGEDFLAACCWKAQISSNATCVLNKKEQKLLEDIL